MLRSKTLALKELAAFYENKTAILEASTINNLNLAILKVKELDQERFRGRGLIITIEDINPSKKDRKITSFLLKNGLSKNLIETLAAEIQETINN
jgi:hypothetical protein